MLEVSYGLGGKPSEEYKQAYLKKLRKKVQLKQHSKQTQQQHDGIDADLANPDTLITSECLAKVNGKPESMYKVIGAKVNWL